MSLARFDRNVLMHTAGDLHVHHIDGNHDDDREVNRVLRAWMN